MARNLKVLADKQRNSTMPRPNPAPIDMPHEAEAPETTATREAAPAQTSTGAKRGRPAATTAPDEVNVTFKISKALFQEIRVKAVMENTTQKEIVTAALRQYLNK